MIIERKLKFEGSLGEKELTAMFDSGATYSCINQRFIEGLEIPVLLKHPIEVETAAEKSYLRIDHALRLDFYLNDLRLSDEFMVIPSLSEEVIIGATTLQKWKIKLDFENDEVITDPRVAKLKLI